MNKTRPYHLATRYANWCAEILYFTNILRVDNFHLMGIGFETRKINN